MQHTGPDTPIVSADQYAEDVTWADAPTRYITLPPNPIHVDASAPDSFLVINPGYTGASGPCDCTCDGYDTDPGVPHVVHQHGTRGFPYASLRMGYKMAEPGWTIIIAAGRYPGALTVAKPLTLEATRGIAVIGR